ncbi:hypothetical protein MTBLM1_130021 [Rhodospirillaceae bacterium LM-1]|nr:hypothetical protein MTBLM1_130021 [Rhodospirillaceae bacterium LM-1]
MLFVIPTHGSNNTYFALGLTSTRFGIDGTKFVPKRQNARIFVQVWFRVLPVCRISEVIFHLDFLFDLCAFPSALGEFRTLQV